MQDSEKKEIQSKLAEFVTKNKSQEKAAKKLKVSGALLSAIKNNNWDSIAESKWIAIGKQVGFSRKMDWKVLKTEGYLEIQTILTDAKEMSSMFAFTLPAGGGKNESIKQFESKNEHVYIIDCSEYFNKKGFLYKILEAMNEDTNGTVAQMMDRIVEKILEKELPLIIFNECDKLRDEILYFLISFYNEMEDMCGIALTATPYFKKRIEDGVKKMKKGYAELYSRCGANIIEVDEVTEEEGIEICRINGMSNSIQGREAYNKSKGDLRRLKRLVMAYQKEEGLI